MRRCFEIGGVFAAVVLVGFGIVAIVLEINRDASSSPSTNEPSRRRNERRLAWAALTRRSNSWTALVTSLNTRGPRGSRHLRLVVASGGESPAVLLIDDAEVLGVYGAGLAFGDRGRHGGHNAEPRFLVASFEDVRQMLG